MPFFQKGGTDVLDAKASLQKQTSILNSPFFLKRRRLKISLAKPFNQRDFNMSFFQKGGTDILIVNASLQIKQAF